MPTRILLCTGVCLLSCGLVSCGDSGGSPTDLFEAAKVPTESAVSLSTAPGAPGRTLYGPETVRRETGEPTLNEWPVSFTAYEAPYTLHVLNGGAGAAPVDAAWIRLNGEVVFGPREFNEGILHLEHEVSLPNPSTLSVRLSGGQETE